MKCIIWTKITHKLTSFKYAQNFRMPEKFKEDETLCSNTYLQRLTYICFKSLYRMFQYMPE